MAITCPDEESFLSSTQPHLWQKGSDGAVVDCGEGFQASTPAPQDASSSLASPSLEWVVLQQPTVPALMRVTLGCAGLCFKTSHKSFIKEVT